jgi:hypothetical protein
MFNLLISITQNIVNINQLWMASIRHPMITDEYYVNDISKITGFEFGMQVFGEDVDITKG